MNRQQEFEQSRINAIFSEIGEGLRTFDSNKIEDNESIAVYLRIKKIVEYIDAHFKIIDWDLVSQQQYNNLTGHTQVAEEMISLWKQWCDNFDRGTLIEVEHRIGRMLPVIQEIVTKAIMPPKPRLLKSVYSEYNKVLNELLAQVDKKDLLQKKQKIDEFYERLLTETEDEPSVQSEIEEKFEEIKAYHKELLGDDEGENDESEESIQQEIENAKEEIEQKVKESHKAMEGISSKIEESSNKQDQLNEFYVRIMGSLNEETKEREDGLAQQLESDLEKFKAYKEQQEEVINRLKERINDLIGEATGAGLASSFHREAEELKKKLNDWTLYFSGTLVALFAVVFVSFLITTFFGGKHEGYTVIVINLLKTLPLTLPLIWLAVFFGARRSETNRLYHEYLHKEVVAKSFSSHRKQVEELGEAEDNQEMLEDLLQATISNIAHNPSSTLDKKHSADMPANKLAEEVREVLREAVKGGKNPPTQP